MAEKQDTNPVEGKWADLHPRTLYLIKQVQYKTYVRLEEALQPIGITSAHFRILFSLSLQAKRSSAELSRMFGVTAQTMIKQIAILESRGLIQRAVAPSNKRILEVELTDEGRRVLDAANKAAVALEASLFASISWDELLQFRGTMLKVLSSLHKTVHELDEYRSAD